jgi:NADH-quinone oxidoreductase subunit B
LNGLIQLQEKIRAQPLTGPDAPRHLRSDTTCDYPVPEFGEHDLVPPKNPDLWRPPTLVRPKKA